MRFNATLVDLDDLILSYVLLHAHPTMKGTRPVDYGHRHEGFLVQEKDRNIRVLFCAIDVLINFFTPHVCAGS